MKLEDFEAHVQKEDPVRFGMVYLTLNKLNGSYYVGQHILCVKCRTLTCEYLGSGKVLNRAIAKYGKENFSRFCIANAYSAEELSVIEVEKISFYSAFKGTMYNIHAMKQNKDHTFSLEYRDRIAEIIKKSHSLRWETSGQLQESIDKVSDKKLLEFHESGYSLGSMENKFKIPIALLAHRLIPLTSCGFTFKKGENEYCELNHRVPGKRFLFTTTDDIEKMISKERLIELFVNQRLSHEEIRAETKLSRRVLERALDHYSIEREKSVRIAHNKRSIEELERLASKETLLKLYLEDNLTLAETACKLNIGKKTTQKLFHHYGISKSYELRRVKSDETKRRNPKPKKKPTLWLPKDEILFWHDRGYTVAGISKKTGFPRHHIAQDLDLLNIPRNHQSMQTCFERTGHVITKDELSQLIEKHSTIKAVAKEVNLSFAIVAGLADLYGIERIRRNKNG